MVEVTSELLDWARVYSKWYVDDLAREVAERVEQARLEGIRLGLEAAAKVVASDEVDNPLGVSPSSIAWARVLSLNPTTIASDRRDR